RSKADFKMPLFIGGNSITEVSNKNRGISQRLACIRQHLRLYSLRGCGPLTEKKNDTQKPLSGSVEEIHKVLLQHSLKLIDFPRFVLLDLKISENLRFHSLMTTPLPARDI